MFVRHVAVSRFRGIKSLDWHLNGRLICLVGPGDSTKTTILDAIELALVPRWYVPFSDADFYEAKVDAPISIHVTVGELGDDLLGEEKCGLYLRGYRENEPVVDDPDDTCEPVVTVRLQVTSDLEPKWELVKESLPEPKVLSWRDRELLGMVRLGNDLERHLTWSRGSALARITEDGSPTRPTLALANRAANAAVATASLTDLEEAATLAQQAALAFGVSTLPLRPGLDLQAMSTGTGALALHDSRNVPLRAAGLGTKRLAALAVEQEGIGQAAIILIDEIEHGLEPHRIRRLLRKLAEDREAKMPETPDEESAYRQPQGQVIMTTHSPTPIMAMPVTNLRFVRSSAGNTVVEQVRQEAVASVQSIVRRLGHAPLAKKLIVCEGKTEEALCNVLDEAWAAQHEGYSFSCRGVVAVDGQGRTQAPSVAVELRRLGYDAAYLGDSDEPIVPPPPELEAKGVTVILWDGGVATEQRVALDVTWEALQKLVGAAITELGTESVLASISSVLPVNLVPCGFNIDRWVEGSIGEAEVRQAIGTTAKKRDWFKDLNRGRTLAQIVVEDLANIQGTELAKSLELLEAWVHG